MTNSLLVDTRKYSSPQCISISTQISSDSQTCPMSLVKHFFQLYWSSSQANWSCRVLLKEMWEKVFQIGKTMVEMIRGENFQSVLWSFWYQWFFRTLMSLFWWLRKQTKTNKNKQKQSKINKTNKNKKNNKNKQKQTKTNKSKIKTKI